LSFDLKLSAHYGSTSVRLPSTDADCVIAFTDDRHSIVGHHPQVAIFEIKMHPPAFARIEMNALKSAQSDARRTLYGREF
jgi:hypothetical protein